MSSSKITQHFRGTIFLTPFVNRRVRLLQSPSLMLRNLRPYATPHPPPTRLPRVYITAISANIVVIGHIGLISMDLLHAWYRNGRKKRLLNETNALKEFFYPMKKTTLTRITSSGIGHGVIYVNVPENLISLVTNLEVTLILHSRNRFLLQDNLHKNLGTTKNELKDPKWVRAMDAFNRASAVYKKKYGKPPAIVYDNISQIVNENPKILDVLQDDAKKNADGRKYIAVFVSSEGSEKSMDYQVNKCGIKTVKGDRINTTEAEKLYELVDNFLLTKQSFEDQSYYEAGKGAIKALLDSNQEIDYMSFQKFFNNHEEANEVLDTNI
ncbi:7787_t:CDS:2 [Acaulospora morrowiae]|uniref:7787_t:CDS:1 n=1 Tax=Acaulospora morrowiae TaxID=94023 RepID=A0A9N8VQR0_9GLOM|nr:7787_t:CDS:2 [Acaulospora morrowiae]